MKLLPTFTLVLLVIVIAVFAVNRNKAQAGPQAGPQAIPAGEKIVVINSDAFSDPTKGIRKLVAVGTTIEREFKPKKDEIDQLLKRYEQLGKEINDTRNVAGAQTLAAKADEAEKLKRTIERKQQDAQAELEKRIKALAEPLYADVNTALLTYARARNINIVLDESKMRGSFLLVNAQIDITTAFIADYNSRNPAASSAP